MSNIISELVDKDRLAVGTRLKVASNDGERVSDDLVTNGEHDDIPVGTIVTISLQANEDTYTEFTTENISTGFCINDGVELEML